MLKHVRIGVLAAALVVVGGGVAAADPVRLTDLHQSIDTADRYRLSASLTDMRVNSVPNMAATAFSREAFVSATSTQTIDSSQVAVNQFPISAGKLEMALQLGCQVSLANGMQMTFGNDGSVDLGNLIGLIEASPVVQDFIPNLTVNLRPGTIKYVTIGKQEITEKVATEMNATRTNTLRLTVHNAYITVDECGGPVSARVVVVAQMRTAGKTFDEINLYGDIVSI